MATTLFIQANNRPAEYSVSVKMYETFLSSYEESYPLDSIVKVNLYDEQLPYLGATMITGNYKVAQSMTLTWEEESEQQIIRKHLEQFLAADKIVIAFPLWNLTVPAVLHTYLDYLHQPRKTFKYTAEGLVGLLPDKKVAILNARGGVYAETEELAVHFVKAHLQVFGIRDITTIVIEGHNQYPDRRDSIIAEGLRNTALAAKGF
ncbi:FMN-dependent NADH-azoreductase [Paenibacillus ferrarius]|uniref:FMN dependent NADH:quinone oxidoreductase n=1 Tax=Paenibacillus ferrarius TaxID=1469647 RepID=A0A1V4H8B9_9BACL|nr:FMN-dependent NADH-azoreductase [Paenibacillus ferrarius]OPH47358.1 FMN-dependent NADH-azoreductase [Paenibacillus ferrarius]